MLGNWRGLYTLEILGVRGSELRDLQSTLTTSHRSVEQAPFVIRAGGLGPKP